jgi:WD40 repeat protein
MNLLTHCPRLLLAALLLIGTAGLLAADDEKPADEKEVNKLLDQLGDEDPDVRQGAREKLFKIGEPALELIRKAIRSHTDPDVRLRAILLARDINVGAFGQLRKFEGHTGHVRTLVVLKDGKRMLSGSMDGTVRLWDIDSGKELKKFDIPGGWGWQIALDPTRNEFIVSGGKNETLHRFDLDTGKELKSYKLPAGHWAYGAAVSKDGRYVFGGVSGKDSDFSIRRFDAVTGKEDLKMTGHAGFVWRLRLSPGGGVLASAGCNDSSFRLWDAASGKELVNGKEAHDGYVVGVAFSPDGKQLLTSARDSLVKLWDVDSGKLLTTYKGLSGDAETVAWSADGKRFLASDGNTVHVFDKDSGKIIHRFEDHADKVYTASFLPDGRRAVSAGEDLVIRMWGVPR